MKITSDFLVGLLVAYVFTTMYYESKGEKSHKQYLKELTRLTGGGIYFLGLYAVILLIIGIATVFIYRLLFVN